MFPNSVIENKFRKYNESEYVGDQNSNTIAGYND